MLSHKHIQTWELWEAARLWVLWGHMMVGGRFEKAYLRIDRATDCSCAEMIYISRNTHLLFWSLGHLRVCVKHKCMLLQRNCTRYKFLPVKSICTLVCDEKLNVSTLLAGFSHTIQQQHLQYSLYLQMFILLSISKTSLSRVRTKH